MEGRGGLPPGRPVEWEELKEEEDVDSDRRPKRPAAPTPADSKGRAPAAFMRGLLGLLGRLAATALRVACWQISSRETGRLTMYTPCLWV